MESVDKVRTVRHNEIMVKVTATRSTKSYKVYRVDQELSSMDQLEDLIESLEADQGGAWSFSNTFGMVDLARAANPSSLPASFYSTSSNRVYYKGQWITFTEAQIIHEQNVGMGQA